MTQSQIDYFLSVSTTKSIAKSAAKLYVSQSAISKQISLLEKEFDLILFDRTNKGVELTDAGSLLFDHFIKQNRAFSNVITNARVLSASHKKQLRFGILESWTLSTFLYKLVNDFNKKDPNVTLNIIGDTPNGLLHRLESGELDLVLCVANALLPDHADSTPKDLISKNITNIKKVIFYSSKNLLSKKNNLSFSDFNDEILYTISGLNKKYALEENILLCNKYGFNPKTITTDNLSTAIMAVSTNQGFTILDEWSTYSSSEQNFLILDEFHPINLFWYSNNPSTVLPLFLETIDNLFK